MRWFISITREGAILTMNTKLLLTAIISFILGALLVSIAATTFEKDRLQNSETSINQTESSE